MKPIRTPSQMYLSCGGSQYSDAVDLELALHTVQYLMDSPIEGTVSEGYCIFEIIDFRLDPRLPARLRGHPDAAGQGGFSLG